jgi:hypothetical protein
MFEKEKELYDRLDSVMDGKTITFSCEEAEILKGIVAQYLERGYEFGEVDDKC